VWLQNPLRWITGPKVNNTRKIPKNYHRSDLKNIFDESFNGHYRYFRELYPAIISLFYSTGIRKSELLTLDVKDWDSKSSLLKVYGSKTGRDRIVPVPDVAWKCLEKYLITRNNLVLEKNRDEKALFVNNNGQRVNGTQLLVQFKRIAKRANVPLATIQMFRHSCATGLIEEGIPLPQVQKILGHSSVITTNRYLSISSPERKKAMKLHPINNLLEKIKENSYE
jgi:site-specific recombinase XerD